MSEHNEGMSVTLKHCLKLRDIIIYVINWNLGDYHYDTVMYLVD